MKMKNFESTPHKMTLTWWLTGPSGAGKTTLAQALAEKLRDQGYAVCVLDGDDIRKGLSSDLGFSLEEREEQGRRVAEMAKILNQNGILAIASLVSPSIYGRHMAFGIIGKDKFIECYISTPLEICQQRDVKGSSAKAKSDKRLQMTGISAPYEAPTAADCVIDTSQTELVAAIEQLSMFLKE